MTTPRPTIARGRRVSPCRVTRWFVVAAMMASIASCSGGSDEDSAPSTIPSVTTERDGNFFDPSNPQGTVQAVPGTAVELGDDVIIATDDGSIPSTTTEPAADPDGPDAPPSNATPTTGPRLALPDPASVERIVSLSPTHTETLFALGLGSFVVGVDPLSDFPAEAVALQQGGLDPDSADLSAVLALDPDVVIVGDDPTDLAGRLGAAGVPVFRGPPAANLADVDAQIRGVAAIVGQPERAEDLIARMHVEIDTIIASLPAPSGLTYFHEIDPSYVTIATGTFLDSIYGELGLTSIVGADPSGIVRATSDIVTRAAPDVVILADVDCCAVTPEVVSTRAGWGSLPAVNNGAIVSVPDALASRWGPRVVDLMRLVAGGVAAAS